MRRMWLRLRVCVWSRSVLFCIFIFVAWKEYKRNSNWNEILDQAKRSTRDHRETDTHIYNFKDAKSQKYINSLFFCFDMRFLYCFIAIILIYKSRVWVILRNSNRRVSHRVHFITIFPKIKEINFLRIEMLKQWLKSLFQEEWENTSIPFRPDNRKNG